MKESEDSLKYMIKKAESQDLDGIMQIWLNVNMTVHNFIPQEYWMGNFDEAGKAIARAEVYVFENKGAIYGFVGLIHSYIAGIFIVETQQSQGIGTLLLEHIKEKHQSLFLHVYKRNRRAIHFYLKNGFRVIDEDVDEITGEPEFELQWTADEGSGCQMENTAGTI